MVIWLTGLPSSGKTTLANELKKIMVLCNCTRKVQILDGDVIRNGICEDLSFSSDDRFENIRRIRHVAKLLSDNGIVVIVAAITPFKEMRFDNRDLIGDGDYVEVFVNTSIDECIRRDVKGLYKKALDNELSDMTGIDDIYEFPTDHDIQCDTDSEDVSNSIKKIVNFIKPRLEKKE